MNNSEDSRVLLQSLSDAKPRGRISSHVIDEMLAAGVLITDVNYASEEEMADAKIADDTKAIIDKLKGG
jgi:hypothetical protein